MIEVTKTITGANSFTDPLTLPILMDPQKKTAFSQSISGTFSATITTQRSFDNGSTWFDVKQFTTPDESIGEEILSAIKYRVGVKTGDFISGTINVRLAIN